MPDRSGPQGSDPLPPSPMDMGEDLISGLPDELLHAILVRLRSARAAARTSVLSHRWRHVWPHVPELHLDRGTEAVTVASFLDAVDGALAGCLAPTLDRLSIFMLAHRDTPVPPGRAAPWLRFAAERVAGELGLYVLPRGCRIPEAELEVPACGRAKKITLFPRDGWRLRLQPAGLFTALTELTILRGRMDGSELSTLVCTRCPRLTILRLFVVLVAVVDISICSDSLRSLWLNAANTRRLEVVAPRLEELTLCHSKQTHVSAPNLAKLIWSVDACNPSNHRFHDVGRRLCLLEIGLSFAAAALMRQFDEVDVLKLMIYVRQGIAKYQGFLNETKTLSKCKTLHISLYCDHRGLSPVILHVLRSCNGTRKFSLTLHHREDLSIRHPCPSSCPCCLEESHRIDDIDLSSLAEVEINCYEIFHAELEFLETLSGCNNTILKKLVINCKKSTTPEAEEVFKKVRGMYGSNVEVEFYVFPNGKWERLDFMVPLKI